MQEEHIKNQFKYCPYCGSKDVFIFDSIKIFKCKHCNRTYFVNPAAAVAALIETPQGIIFTERRFDPKKGFIDSPGGFLNLNERAEDGIRRELLEEINFCPDNLEFLCTYTNNYVYEEMLYTTLDLHFYSKLDFVPNCKAGDDALSITFIKRENIDFNLIAFDTSVNAIKFLIEKKPL